jgi:hypothetical protein
MREIRWEHVPSCTVINLEFKFLFSMFNFLYFPFLLLFIFPFPWIRVPPESFEKFNRDETNS